MRTIVHETSLVSYPDPPMEAARPVLKRDTPTLALVVLMVLSLLAAGVIVGWFVWGRG
jgi:hypothetical protein